VVLTVKAMVVQGPQGAEEGSKVGEEEVEGRQNITGEGSEK